MRTFVTYIFALCAFACYVAADCCDAPCADGTSGTPCCGNGKCNIFCCNCDDGCRKENYAECVNIAAGEYNNRCMLCVNIGVCTVDECEANYNAAVTSCGWQYPNGKRSAPLISRDPSSGADDFSMLDHEGRGNITLDQYMEYMQGRNPAMHEVLPSQEDWAAWFNKFDANGDGVIDYEEHHRYP